MPPLLQEGKGEACLLCGACTDACPTTALRMSGRDWPIDELMAVVEKRILYQM